MVFFFGLIACIQLFYWLVLYAGFRNSSRLQETGDRSATRPMSVVIAARNEERNLPALRTALESQRYPEYEVIVADDGSDDATPTMLEDWARAHPNVRSIRVTEPAWPRKKNALTHAIRTARHEHLAFTDADCRPGKDWLRSLAAAYDSGRNAGPEILVGYGPYARRPGLLNRLVRYETLVTAFLTAGAIGLNRPFMAVGRNLSYPAHLFKSAGGFEHSSASLSGDDDLFVQHAAGAGLARVKYVADPASFVISDPPESWRKWIRQKTRHNSAGRFYKTSFKVHLGLFQATNLLVWLAPVFLGALGLALWGARQVVQFIVLTRAASTLREGGLMVMQPFLDLLYVLYNLLIAPFGVILKPKRW